MGEKYFLRTIGTSPQVTYSDLPVRFGSRRALGLLAYLAIPFPRFIDRDTLCNLLWTAGSCPESRHRLSQIIYSVEMKCPGVIVRQSNLVAVSSILTCDAVGLMRAFASGSDNGMWSSVAGEFLPGFKIVDAPVFSEWLDDRRDELRTLVHTAINRALVTAESNADWETRASLETLARNNGVNLLGNFVATSLQTGSPQDKLLPIQHRSRQQGRVDEFQRITSFVLGDSSGPSRLAIVGGTTGCGKSMFLENVARLGVIRGYKILTLKCHESERNVPFSAVSHLLRENLKAANLERLDTATRLLLSDLIPDICERPPADQIAIPQNLYLARLYAAVQSVAIDSWKRPVCIVIDDADWTDRASAELFNHLMKRGSGGPANWCISTERNLDWIADVDALHLSLRPLPDKWIRQIVSDSSGGPEAIGDDLVDWICQLANGNPLIAVELANAAVRIPRGEARLLNLLGTFEVPPSIRSFTHKKLQAIGDKAKNLLATIAILGRYANANTVLQASIVSPKYYRESITELLDQTIIRIEPTGEYQLFSGVLRKQVLDAVLPGTRIRILERCGVVLSKHVHVPAEVIARVFEEADNPAMACRYFLRAATENVARHAHKEARRSFESALEYSPFGAARARAAGLFARYLTVIGLYEEADRYFEVQEKNGTHAVEPAARIAKALASYYRHLAPASKVRRELEAVLSAISVEASESLTMVALETLVITAHEEGAADVVRGACQIAVRLASKSDSHELRARCYASASKGYLLYGDVEDSGVFAHKAVELADLAGDHATRIQALSARAMVLYQQGQLEAAIDDFALAESLAQGPLSHLAVKTTAFRGVVLIDLGRFDEAEECFRLAMSRRTGNEDSIAMVHMAALEIDRGRYAEAFAWISKARDEAGPHPGVWLESAMSGIGGLAAHELGDAAVCHTMATYVEKTLSQDDVGAVVDVSYGVIFLARRMADEGLVIAAAEFVRRWANTITALPAASRLRLEIEYARLCAFVDSATAWRLAADAEDVATKIGAAKLREQAAALKLASSMHARLHR
jgi:tetratricopeptide (TPR) repeat protein